MTNPEAENRISELFALYEQTWGKELDFIGLPGVITQENLVTILERIVDTGESILVGWEELFL